MAVRSRRFGVLASTPSNTWTTVYEVPQGRTALLKFCAVFNATVVTRTCNVRVRTAGGTEVIIARRALAQGETWEPFLGELAMNPGDALELHTGAESTSTAVRCYTSGALLDGPPT